MNSKLKKLQQKWYKKLKDSGFEDIENTSHPDRPPIRWHAHDIRRMCTKLRKEEVTSRIRYFELATIFLNDHVFETSKEKLIWSLHANGDSYSETAKKVRMSKSSIGNVVARLRKVMLGRD